MSETNVVIRFKCDVSQAHAVVGRAVGVLQEFADVMGIELTAVEPHNFSVVEGRSAGGIGPKLGSYWKMKNLGDQLITAETYRVVPHNDVNHPFVVRAVPVTGFDDASYWQGSVAEFNQQFEEWRG